MDDPLQRPYARAVAAEVERRKSRPKEYDPKTLEPRRGRDTWQAPSEKAPSKAFELDSDATVVELCELHDAYEEARADLAQLREACQRLEAQAREVGRCDCEAVRAECDRLIQAAAAQQVDDRALVRELRSELRAARAEVRTAKPDPRVTRLAGLARGLVARGFDWLDFLERVGVGLAVEGDPWEYFGELDPEEVAQLDGGTA